MKAWIDGAIVEGTEARIPVLDHGFLYGDGVFEGLRVYAGRVFRLDDHLRRLGTSARAIGLRLPGTDALREIVLATARAHGAPDAYVRLIVTRGTGSLGVDPESCRAPRTVCIVDDVTLFDAEKEAAGLDLVTVSVRRPAQDVLDPRVKSLNYLNSVLARREARLRGADDGLILNAAGNVAEASGANVFAVRDGAVLTPPATDGSLEGVTQRTLLELGRDLALPFAERSLGRTDLLGADEVFLAGTGARVVAVRSLDGETIPGATPGPVTLRLREAYLDRARRQGTPLRLPEPRVD